MLCVTPDGVVIKNMSILLPDRKYIFAAMCGYKSLFSCLKRVRGDVHKMA